MLVCFEKPKSIWIVVIVRVIRGRGINIVAGEREVFNTSSNSIVHCVWYNSGLWAENILLKWMRLLMWTDLWHFFFKSAIYSYTTLLVLQLNRYANNIKYYSLILTIALFDPHNYLCSVGEFYANCTIIHYHILLIDEYSDQYLIISMRRILGNVSIRS